MELPGEPQIAWRKIIEYLLVFRSEDDKSEFLAKAGYTHETAERLMDDIRVLSKMSAVFVEATEYGENMRFVAS
jgi:hypothetical protein